MEFKAAIFDLDGTLVNSIDGIAYSMNLVLKRHNLAGHKVEAYKSMVGNGVKELVKKAVPAEIITDDLLNVCLLEMKEVYSENWGYGMHVYEGIGDLLQYLSNKNILLSVNTNKDEAVSRSVMRSFFNIWNFACLVGGDSLATRKPDPEGAVLIAEKLGVRPESCIYIGDSEVDVMTARNANMYSVGALWGFRDKQVLLDAGAAVIIKEPLELMELL